MADTAAADGGARRAKRPRLEADRRRDMLEGVENKFANIDFTRYQYLAAGDAEAGAAEAGTAEAGRFVPVVPVPTAVVQNWRQLDSYERDGDTSYSEDEFTALHNRAGHHRRHYTGPFGCTVQSNVPDPGELLCKAGKPVQGRSALQKLQKQLGTMCLRLEVGHFRVTELEEGDTLAADIKALGPAATKRKNVVRWWGCIAGTCCMRSPSSSHLSWITLSMPAVRSWSANAVLRPAATKTSVTVVQSRSCCCSVPRLGPAATKRKDVVRWWGCIAGTCCRAWRSRRSAQHKNLHGEVKSNDFWP